MKSGRLLVGMLILMILGSHPVIAQVNSFVLKGIINSVHLNDNVIAGGAISDEGLENAFNQGIKTVIDLRTPLEGTDIEETKVKILGMNYFNIPVSSRTLSRQQVDRVAKIIEDPKNLPAILHCGSGNRVGAVWALYLHFYKNVGAEDALSEAVQKGLNNPQLIEITRQLLN